MIPAILFLLCIALGLYLAVQHLYRSVCDAISYAFTMIRLDFLTQIASDLLMILDESIERTTNADPSHGDSR